MTIPTELSLPQVMAKILQTGCASSSSDRTVARSVGSMLQICLIIALSLHLTLKVLLDQGPSLAGMEHPALHTSAIDAAACLVGDVA